MHLGMPECHKPFLGHCDLDLWPRFQELLCPEHISYIIWFRNPKFWVMIPLGMAEWCIPFWVTLTLTLASGLISSFFVLYYSYLSSNVSYTRPIPLGAFVTCLWHFLFSVNFLNIDGKIINYIIVSRVLLMLRCCFLMIVSCFWSEPYLFLLKKQQSLKWFLSHLLIAGTGI